MKLNKITILLAFLLLANFVSVVNAVQINTDKTNLDFNNVRRDGYASNTLTITTNSDEDIGLNYIITGDLKNFISISAEKEFFVNQASPLNLLIEVKPDKSIANGIHTGNIIFTFQSQGQTQISSQPNSFIISYNVEITDKIIKQAIVKSIDISDINYGSPLNAIVEVENKGNIPVQPILELSFKDNQDALKKYSLSTNEKILPGQDKTINYQKTISELNLGIYELESKIIIDNNIISQQSQNFYVLNINEPARRILLKGVENANKIHVTDNIEIKAFISNNGQDSLIKFKAKVSLGDEFITNLEGPEIIASSNKETISSLNFKPIKTGIYTIKGYIEYGSRKTEEIETVFEAVPETQNLKEVPLSSNPLLAIIIMLISIFTIVKINKNRQKKR